MALITCPECSKEISDKAVACPTCGYPIENFKIEVEKELGNKIKCPYLPENPDIGKQIVNWGGDAAFTGEYHRSENAVDEIDSGIIQVIMNEQGISINSKRYLPFLSLHFKQIIDVAISSGEELAKSSNSVLGRAVVGGFLLGPVGAIVGGMSGLQKEKIKAFTYLIINYWDLSNKKPQTLLIRGEKHKIKAFKKRLKEEIRKTQYMPVSTKIKSEGCAGVLLILIMSVSFFSYILT